ncbi:MerR family transcriptional regulator [Phascolarctobacterium sp.]|uniref:MerR family transcriptional regulator n=1 Tax=Phascolarctobacterium sp. TaxID=2049039 RepID=UPI00260D6635|nr:MerR family transcriptional regulator [uncultured Phascolarctobacterium sp.]
MEKNKKKLFTTGELAALCKIHRKTLLFYDKLGLINPEFIDDNGYRYYSRRQFFSLEIILALRKLDMSLPEIKTYLNAKSLSNYKNLLKERTAVLDKLLLTIQKMRSDLDERIDSLEAIELIQPNSISLACEQEEYLCLSAPIPPNADLKIRTKISANHFLNVSNYFSFNDHIFGYILDREAFTNGQRPHTKFFFNSIPQALDSPYFFLKPAGLYVNFYFKGIYCSYGKPYLDQLYSYVKDNKLEVISDVYMTSIKNHWVTDDNSNYLNKLSLQIKEKEVEL